MNELELKTYGELLCQLVDCLQFDKETKKRINAHYREHKRTLNEQKRQEIDARKALRAAKKMESKQPTP